jgi:hypothetical protein
MAKFIKLGYQCFLLPEGMSGKDIQAFAGFMLTLQRVETRHNFTTGHDMHYNTGPDSVRLFEGELFTIEDATRISDETHEAYKAKRDLNQA